MLFVLLLYVPISNLYENCDTGNYSSSIHINVLSEMSDIM